MRTNNLRPQCGSNPLEMNELQDELRNLRITERRIAHLIGLMLVEIYRNQCGGKVRGR